MITRLYVNNFRCLVAFEARFDSFAILCGPNGSGKSSVFDALRFIQDLTAGDSYLGGDGPQDVRFLEFTKWIGSRIQEFELEMMVDGRTFSYLLHIEQAASHEKPRIIRERVSCDQQEMFDRDLEGVNFRKNDGSAASFPLDWRQSALAAIRPTGALNEVEILQRALSRVLILQPNPRNMEKEGRREAQRPKTDLSDLTSWFRSLNQEQEWTDSLRDSLKVVWPDFRSFRMNNPGLPAKILLLRFDGPKEKNFLIPFHRLSDGEKALVGLYMVRSALATGAAQTVLIDEPDNYVGLPELQPWVFSLLELLDDQRQAILISHHPEILKDAGEESGRYLWRDNHTSPTRIGPLKVPAGLSPGEAVARGWIGE